MYDKQISNTDFSEAPLPDSEFENCTFTACNFSGVDLSGLVFEECTFEDCNLSNALLNQTALKSVKFRSCKMLGLDFSLCKTFLLEFDFEHCQMSMCAFPQMKIPRTRFSHCQLQDVDFAEANLSEAVFDHCDLAGAIFEYTNLQGADLRTASNFYIDPETNPMKKARFSQTGLIGLLRKYDLRVE
ncbi:MAG: hypothetical protein CMN32_05470 [Saprospirales bacterium]|nr:hypothetical protein [Saprospirales bacterium]